MRNKIVRFLMAVLLPAAAGFAQTRDSPGVILPGQTGFFAYVGDPFSQTFTCNCGLSAVTWRIDAGSLPSGILLNAATGVMSGTPAAAQTLSFAISAVQAGTAIVSRQYSFSTVVHQLTWVTAPTLPVATAGVPVSRTLQANLIALWTPGPSTLPAGVSLVLPPNGGTSATLTGTFPAIATVTTYTFQLTVTNFPIPFF